MSKTALQRMSQATVGYWVDGGILRSWLTGLLGCFDGDGKGMDSEELDDATEYPFLS